MKIWLSQLWRGKIWPETVAAYTPIENKAKSIATSVKGGAAAIFFLALLVLVVYFASGGIDEGDKFLGISSIFFTPRRDDLITSWVQAHRQRSDLPRLPKAPSNPITLNCPAEGQSKAPTCTDKVSASPSPSPSPASPLPAPSPEFSPAPSCPEYFRWIHEDLRPWKDTGITRETVESARKLADFRLVVLGGRAYVETYRKAWQTRDTFTHWGILQLLSRYPGRLPDVDLMFNCDDPPAVKAANYKEAPAPPPPLFHYSKDDETLDILFPDWTFWGWPEVNIKPWKTLVEEMKEENGKVKWKDRRPYAYWKGNPETSEERRNLMKCNVSNSRDSGARLYKQNWDKEIAQGKAGSEFAQEELKMEYIYDYMLHLLIQYSKLLRYKPTVPAGAKELCPESMACTAGETIREFMLESMARWTHEDPPCALPPPYRPEELREFLAMKTEVVENVKRMERKGH